MLGQGVLTVLGEVVVAHGVLRLAAHERGLIPALLAGGVELVAEAAPGLVDPHGLGQAVHLAGDGQALHVHAGDGGRLQVGAGPVGHLHAAAVVGRHGVQRFALDERLGHIGHEVGHHVGVAAHAAAGADDGLAGDFHVAVGVGGHKAGHGAVLHDDVLGGGAEVELGAGLLGRSLVVHLDLGLVAFAVEGAHRRPELDAG